MDLDIFVFDDILGITEEATCSLDALWASVFDATAPTQENLVIGEDPMDTLFVQENLIETSDYGDVFDRPFISTAGDEILVQTVNVDLDVLPSIVVSDDVNITEYAETNNDYQIIVNDPIGPLTESTSLGFSTLFIDLFDSIGPVTEYIEPPSPAFLIDVFDPIFIDAVNYAFGSVSWTVNVNDVISETEFFYFGFEVIDLSIFETILIVEAPILGRDPEVLFAFTSVTVSEVAFLQTTTNLEFNDFLRSYPFIEETLTNITSEVFENGSEQRRDKWGRTKKRFNVVFSPRLKSEIDQIRAFYESRRGPAHAFDFINPLDGVDYVVRFEENTFQVKREAYNIYSAQVTIVEVFT